MSTTTDSTTEPTGKIIACAQCGGIHPTDAPCKPWGGADE